MFFALGDPSRSMDGRSARACAARAARRSLACSIFGLNSGIVAVAIGLERHESIVAIWREHFAGLWLTYFGGVFAAMLLMLLGRVNPLETLILIVPLPVILYVTFRHAVGRAEDRDQPPRQGEQRLRRAPSRRWRRPSTPRTR